MRDLNITPARIYNRDIIMVVALHARLITSSGMVLETLAY